MIYYFIPDSSIFGGIKVGYQFSQLLNELDVPCVVASPDGSAPDWFQCSVPVVRQDWAQEQITENDVVMFSLPHDYQRLKSFAPTLVFHCNGTDPLIEPIVADPAVKQITCWKQATDYMSERGAESVEVGISISDCFFYSGAEKQEQTACYMPRRGEDICQAVQNDVASIDYHPIENLDEDGVSEVMQQSEYYLATSEGEWFGLPALEAMASGCIVLSVPVLGGMEYLEHEKNCSVSNPANFPTTFKNLVDEQRREKRFEMRQSAIATASRYRLSRQKERLPELLSNQLRYLRS